MSGYASCPSRFKVTRPYQMLGREQKVFEGRILNSSCWKTFDTVEALKGVRASDFSLDNILAVGAFDSLRPCSVSMNTRQEMGDFAESQMENLNDAVDFAAANQNQTVE